MAYGKVLLKNLTIPNRILTLSEKNMDFKSLYSFLEQLQANNSKEWMDANRDTYHSVRDAYIDWLDHMNIRLNEIDPDYFNTPGKKAINRINNNLMFHPSKPIYKDHFGAGLDQRSKQGDFYIHLGVSESFIGGGYWHPSSKTLKSIRAAIDYNGEELKRILNTSSFKKMFGELIDDNPLKRSPKKYSEKHEHIDLLKHRSFAVSRNFSPQQVCSPNFEAMVIETYIELLPFRRYLNKAVTV